MALSLPIVIDPTAHTIASINVDFPLPFSPTKNVTGLLKINLFQVLINGRLKGNYRKYSDELISTLRR
jgi:hypothetical protein